MNFLEKWLLKRLCKKVKRFAIAETTIRDGYCITMDKVIIVLRSDGFSLPNRPGYDFFVGHLSKELPFIG